MSYRSIFIVSLIIICAGFKANGQSGPGVDEMFERARKEAFAGNRKESRDICAEILAKSPDYHDARLLLGRLYAWDGDYESARRELVAVVESRPGYADARNALIDVELWAGRPEEALKHSDAGLDREPGNEDFLYRKARALKAMGKEDSAIITARRLLDYNPGHKEAQSLIESMGKSDWPNKLTVEYTHDFFDRSFEPWRQISVSYARRLPFGSVIGRVNYANRFQQTATQYEVDAYPKLRKGTYAYLNAGYSSHRIFPHLRFGGEVYQNYSKGFEGSIGMRHLRFRSSNVNIFTGSVGKYYGNYWFSFRPFITPSEAGTSQSASVIIRKYFETVEDYVTVTVGAGSSPDERYTTLEQYRLKSQRVSFDFRRRIGKGLVGSAYVGLSRQEVRIKQHQKRYTFGFALEKYF